MFVMLFLHSVENSKIHSRSFYSIFLVFRPNECTLSGKPISPRIRVKGGSPRISQKLVSKIGPHRVLLKHAATKIYQTVHSVDVGPKIAFGFKLLKNCPRFPKNHQNFSENKQMPSNLTFEKL